MVELQALGKAGRHDVEPALELGLLGSAGSSPRTLNGNPAGRAACDDLAEPGVRDDQADRALGLERSSGRGQRPRRPARSSARRRARPACGAPRSAAARVGAIVGSRRAAYAITSPGTRKPRVSSSTVRRRAGRGGRSASSQLPTDHGGGGLGEVAEHGHRAGGGLPPDRAQHHRREVLRLVEHDVAEAGGALDQVGRLADQDRVVQRPLAPCRGPWPAWPRAMRALLVVVEDAVGRLRPGSPASPSSRITTLRGSTAGQSASTYCLTGRLRATEFCTRSSGESPAISILTRIVCASRCGSIARPAPYRTPRVRSSATSSSASYAGTRHRRAPIGTTSPSVAGRDVRPERARRAPRPSGRRP